MPSSRIARQVLFFTLAVLVPAVMLLVSGIVLMDKEDELAIRRTQDFRTFATRQLADSLLLALESAHEATEIAQGTARYSATTPPLLLLGRPLGHRRSDGNPATVERDLQTFLRETAQAEATGVSSRTLVARLRKRLERETEPVPRGFVLLRLGGLLRRSGMVDPAREADLTLLEFPSTVSDDFGLPFAYYAAERLLKADSNAAAVRSRLRADLHPADWLSSAALSFLQDLIGMTGDADAAALLRQVDEHRLAKTSAWNRSTSSRPRWQLDESGRWLVRSAPSDTSLVVAVQIAALAGLFPRSLAGLRAGPPENESERVLSPPFPSLVAALRPDALPAAGNQNRFFLAGLSALLGLTAFGGYLLWRDVRRETRLSQLRARFVSSVSHELRTPLTSIRLFAESMLTDGSTDDAERARGLGIIAGESERLTRMLNNVLTTSQIEQGKLTYHRSHGDLADVTARAADAMRYEYEPAGVALEVTTEPALARFDADAVEQALINLLSNALKYGASGKVVSLSCTANGTSAHLSVSDHGPGIPASEHKAVFERYYRTADASAGRTAGAGLGLALVQHVAEGHDGRVRLESAPGSGTTVTIDLPLEEA